MKKCVYISLVALATSLTLQAQDDVYFVPSKANVEKSTAQYGLPRNTYYSGSRRSIDEYNRRFGSYVQPIDSTGNDIVNFDGRAGVYPDSIYADGTDDYRYTRRMNRFDDYAWEDPYRAGFYAGRASSWYWNSSWYWDDPFYWDDPYYGYYSSWTWGYPYYRGWGWSRPWHYGAWYWPYYRPAYVISSGRPYRNGQRRFSPNDFYGGNNPSANSNGRNFTRGNFNGQRGNFNGARSSNVQRQPSFSSPSMGSFGGARSGGSFGGGGFSGGSRVSGSFGGQR